MSAVARGRKANIARLLGGFRAHVTAISILALLVSVLSLAPPLMTANMIDAAIPRRDFRLLLFDVVGVVLCALVAAALTMIQGQISTYVAQSTVKRVRTAIVAHLFRVPLDFYVRTKGGALMSRACNDIESLGDLLATTLPGTFGNVVTVAVTCVTMCLLDWRLAMITIPLVVAMVIPVKITGSKMYAIRALSRKVRDDLTAGVYEKLSLSGITMVKAYTREDDECRRVDAAGEQTMNLEMRLSAAAKLFIACTGVLGAIGPAIIWLYGGWLAMSGQLPIGIMVSFAALITTRLYGPLGSLATTHVQLIGALAVVDRICEYLQMPTEAPTGVDARFSRAIPMSPGVSFAFRNVCFAYDSSTDTEQQRPLTLQSLDFEVRAGEAVAFVGPSGAGKTTIIHLLMRFFDPQQGCISINDRDLRSIDLHAWRRRLAIVTQETYLFHDTILENIRCGDPKATDRDVVEAAKMANIHEAVQALPAGYNTIVGERGFKLSGGERQRLAIARALLKRPSLLLLDEATSSLDCFNEAAVQRSIEQGIDGRTAVIVAHRLSTVLRCDRVFYIEDGRILETGSPSALLDRGGPFAMLYKYQSHAAIA